MKRLVLLRHAKSSYPFGVADHDRPLDDRGRHEAPEIGRLLMEHVGVPDAAVVSSALRTQQTWALVAPQFHVEVPWRTESALYEASTRTMLNLIRATDPAVETLIVVAHNPGTEDLAEQLIDSHRSYTEDVVQQHKLMLTKFPTAAAAVIRSEREWELWEPGCGTFEHFLVGRP